MTAGAFVSLSPIECHILLGVAGGKTNSAIGDRVHLAAGTVRNYISGMMDKLACDNRAALAAYATANGLASLRFWEPDPNATMYDAIDKTMGAI